MASVHTVLVVEDDFLLCQVLGQYISNGNKFTVRAAGTLREAEAALNGKDNPVAAMIIDVNLPDGDGRDFCARLRRQGRSFPIIILSGANRPADIVRGLDAGANDYIVKPFGPEELMARLRAQMRVFESSDDASFAIGCYTFHPSTRHLQERGSKRRVRLTHKEVAILKVLYRSDTRPVPRQILMQEVWGYNPAVTTHTLETHIYRLRQKMELDPRNPVLLVTERLGYVLDPDVGAAAGA
jgi:DNA-binding response OmpR family regulator